VRAPGWYFCGRSLLSFGNVNEIESLGQGMDTRILVCKTCGCQFEQHGPGRSRHYCGPACYEKNRYQVTKLRGKKHVPRGPRNAIYASDAQDAYGEELGPGLELVTSPAQELGPVPRQAPRPRGWRNRPVRCAYCGHPVSDGGRYCAPICEDSAELWEHSDCPECSRPWRGNPRCRCGHKFNAEMW
jgi:hypothetical protein